jgi:hypothetical protein
LAVVHRTPLHRELKAALETLHERERATERGEPDDFVVVFTKGATDLVTRSNSVQFLFRTSFTKLGFAGAKRTTDVHHPSGEEGVGSRRRRSSTCGTLVHSDDAAIHRFQPGSPTEVD